VEEKFCSSCQTYRPASDMKLVATANRGVKRWKCSSCFSKASVKKYQSKEK